MRAISAKSAKARASIAIRLIKARRTHGRSFSNCFEMGDGDDVIREILQRAENDPEIEHRYPHVAEWRRTFGENVVEKAPWNPLADYYGSPTHIVHRYHDAKFGKKR